MFGLIVAAETISSRTAGREDGRRGLLFGTGAYVLWGLFPVYWPLLEPAGAVEILAHRVLWSLVFVALVLAIQRRWRGLWTLGGRRTGLLAGAAVLIAVNWTVYIWGVNNGHVVETSLGYFVNPLGMVLLGVLVLHERLRQVQWVAVGIGLLAVVVLTLDYGRPPWIALTLAFSFGTYGLVRKSVGAGAVDSLGVETAVLALPAVAYLGWLAAVGEGTFGQVSGGHTLLLMLAGPVTALPLLLFGGAARRLPLTVLGLLQYLAPVLQFLFGVLLYHEEMPPARLAGFGLVWVALAVLTVDGVRHQRRSAALARAAESIG